MNTLQSDPQIILKSFEKIRADSQRKEKQIATKQDIAARKKDKELVEQASTYTPEPFFKDWLNYKPILVNLLKNFLSR